MGTYASTGAPPRFCVLLSTCLASRLYTVYFLPPFLSLAFESLLLILVAVPLATLDDDNDCDDDDDDEGVDDNDGCCCIHVLGPNNDDDSEDVDDVNVLPNAGVADGGAIVCDGVVV